MKNLIWSRLLAFRPTHPALRSCGIAFRPPGDAL